jgi:hypothetical protein
VDDPSAALRTGAAARRCASAAAPVHHLIATAVRVDHPDRSAPFRTRAIAPVLLRCDGHPDLPLLALDAIGKPQARFAHLADLAWFLRGGINLAPTLPRAFVALARGDAIEQLELLR